MIILFGSVGLLVALALVFATLIAAVIGIDSDRGKLLLRQFLWFRRFERLGTAELQHRGMIAAGFGICCFAALLSLRLFEPVSLPLALAIGILAVVSITLGAGLLERAGNLDR